MQGGFCQPQAILTHGSQQCPAGIALATHCPLSSVLNWPSSLWYLV